MNFADKYINKQNKDYFFESPVLTSTIKMVVVVPCYNEPELKKTIQSLINCDKPDVNVAVIIVVNDSELSGNDAIEQNQKTIKEIDNFKYLSPDWLSIFSIYASKLPHKNAGAGWARKIGMDWAITHFNRSDNKQGIIISLDADTTVKKNYFSAILNYYSSSPNSIGATIYFEHPIQESNTKQAITLYELYMRYYKNTLKYIAYPNSIYTIGSAFTVNANAYVLQGGMNRKKAGEDFYFLQKLIPFGELGEIVNTKTYPSARISNRVPFGTGPLLNKYYEGDRSLEMTYQLSAFELLKPLFENIDFYYHNVQFSIEDITANPTLQSFLISNNFCDELKELIANCSSVEVYRKRFFHSFNAFKILKWLNYSASNGFDKKSLIDESKKLITRTNPQISTNDYDANKMLNLYRHLDKTI